MNEAQLICRVHGWNYWTNKTNSCPECKITKPLAGFVMRDQKTKQALIEYLQKGTDERLFQAISNFTGIQYLGSASDPSGKDFKDLFYVEADENLDIEGLEAV